MYSYFRDTTLKNFLHRSSSERRLWFEAFFFLILIRVELWILPFSWIRSRHRRRVQLPSKVHAAKPHSDQEWEEAKKKDLQCITWAIMSAARFVPKATCLTQAMVGQYLLARRGIVSDIRIGVGKQGFASFHAHAWLEVNDRIVLGKKGTENVNAFPLFDF